jgi:hypothetical protein
MKETMESTWSKFQQELVSSDIYCEECDNGTDTPCTNCLWEESVK